MGLQQHPSSCQTADLFVVPFGPQLVLGFDLQCWEISSSTFCQFDMKIVQQVIATVVVKKPELPDMIELSYQV